MTTRQDGGAFDQVYYDMGFYQGKNGLRASCPGETIDQQMSYEDGYNAGLYEYRQAHGGEPEGSGGGVG